jgi:hypothetical protein
MQMQPWQVGVCSVLGGILGVYLWSLLKGVPESWESYALMAVGIFVFTWVMMHLRSEYLRRSEKKPN